jgi:(p)ppGpp synthase/HD superfamily hydrolase
VATIEKALEIAAKAHNGVKDKQGEPYILHPIRVMMGVDGESARIVGVLHDVVEDTEVTIDDIKAEGFSDEVLAALALVTHAADQSYADYVVACKANDIARQVKLSDLRDNSSLNRLLMRPEKFQTDAARMQKYVLSYRFLSDEVSEADYRNLMTD